MTDKHSEEMRRMRLAVAESTGERHCAYCNSYKPLEGGRFKATSNARKWICKDCHQLRRKKRILK
tara:strand:+ start:420 stop:614 length:195 start_codon:yes stop_codon:yes gene_type:complete